MWSLSKTLNIMAANISGFKFSFQAASNAPSAKRPRSSSEDVDVEAEARKGNVCIFYSLLPIFLIVITSNNYFSLSLPS
jgi:hypothetical protein